MSLKYEPAWEPLHATLGLRVIKILISRLESKKEEEEEG